jgi:hypothetical protein
VRKSLNDESKEGLGFAIIAFLEHGLKMHGMAGISMELEGYSWLEPSYVALCTGL